MSIECSTHMYNKPVSVTNQLLSDLCVLLCVDKTSLYGTVASFLKRCNSKLIGQWR